MPSIATIYEIIGLAISAILAVIAYTQSNEKSNKGKFAVIIFMLGTTISYLISIRYDYMDKVVENNLVKKDPLAYNLATEWTLAHEGVNNSEDKFTHLIFDERTKLFNSFLEDIKKGSFIVQQPEFEDLIPKLIELADNKSQIFATSYVAPGDWWKTNWGKNYLQKNLDAIKERNCEIERIYIFKDTAEYIATRPAMDAQKKNKIRIRYTFTSEITSNQIYELTSDIIIIDDNLAGKLFLTVDRVPTYAIFYIDATQIEKLKSNYEKLKNFTSEYK